MIKKFYLDTYAIIEILKGNPNYEKYKKGIKVILADLNLMELSYFLIKEGREKEVKGVLDLFSKYKVDYNQDILTNAAKLKFKHLKERISFIDWIGYLLAKKNNAKFLTGDEHFRDKDNVEFAK